MKGGAWVATKWAASLENGLVLEPTLKIMTNEEISKQIMAAAERGARQYSAMQLLVANLVAQREGNTDAKHAAEGDYLATVALQPSGPTSQQALIVFTFLLPEVTRAYVRQRVRAMEVRLAMAKYDAAPRALKQRGQR